MIRVISANVNGIRSAARKGFFDWMGTQNADFVCLQEIKAQADQLSDPIFHPQGYHVDFWSAQKKGYSGVALYSKHPPQSRTHTLGWATADTEGRYLACRFANFNIVSLYLPSGSSGAERQGHKMVFLDKYFKILSQQVKEPKPYIICGDWNIAHKPIDLKNWKTNQRSSGFLPEERAWMDKLIDELGWLDAFRVLNQEPEQYSWWSARIPTAWDNNVGWRIDYQIVSPSLKNKIKQVSIYRGEKFSDHAPVIVDYDLEA